MRCLFVGSCVAAVSGGDIFANDPRDVAGDTACAVWVLAMTLEHDTERELTIRLERVHCGLHQYAMEGAR